MDKPWKVIVSFVGVFLAGAIVGGVLTLRVAEEKAKSGRPVGPPPSALQLMRRFADRLELTEEQKEQLKPILVKADDDFQRLRRDNFREAGQVMEHMHAEVAAVLTPAQLHKLEEMKTKFRERADKMRKEFRERREGGERGPPPEPADGPMGPGEPPPPPPKEQT